MGTNRIKTKQDAINLLNEQNRTHKGKWLTMEAVEIYQRKAYNLQVSTGEMKGRMYGLMLELMEEYGVTQLEATNILNGHDVSDYVNKYYRIQNLIPLDIKEKNTKKNDDEGNDENIIS